MTALPRTAFAHIRAEAPLPFERFMDLALYAPGAGYYTSTRDPFGTRGDFFTAEQIQPTFGILIARAIEAHSTTTPLRVLELGPGRRDMAPVFSSFDYTPVDVDDPLPATFEGIVFANEFFDALPVHLVERKRNGWRERYVGVKESRCIFSRRTHAVDAPVAAYLERYHSTAPVGSVVEVNLRALEWIRRIGAIVRRGAWIIIDYGYTAREWPRHSHGTLMSYRRHIADSSVLDDPGARDITAHVAWAPLEDTLVQAGWRIRSFTTLARTLLEVGERDHFACVLEGCDAKEDARRRLQLKTLLFNLGETFRVLVAEKDSGRVLHK